MLIGYARVSTGKQNPDSQRDALEAEGGERVFLDVVSGAAKTLPEREAALGQLREGDTFVARRLPRLAAKPEGPSRSRRRNRGKGRGLPLHRPRACAPTPRTDA